MRGAAHGGAMTRRRTRRRPRRAITVLAIAASDSGGGAGVQADLLTIAAHGLHGAAALTAVTAQDTRRIHAVEPVSVPLVKRQIEAVFDDLRPAAVKIGALYDAARVAAVAATLESRKARNVVLDPVLESSSGQRLLAENAIPVLLRRLLPLCNLVTPNLPEAEILSGVAIRTETDLRSAAQVLARLGARAVLIKGGHAAGRVVSDLLYDGRTFREYRHLRVATRATHGTGCTLSAAIAARLARGQRMRSAVEGAIGYVEAALRAGRYPGKGQGVLGRSLRDEPAR